MFQNTYPFFLPQLLYSYSALEPHISEETMHFHYDKHFNGYISKLNNILKDYPNFQNYTLKKLLCNIYSLPTEIQEATRNNAGGVYNHMLYFDIINPNKSIIEPKNITRKIIEEFGSINNFFDKFKAQANEVFGSGYVFVVLNSNGKIEMIKTKNQDSVFELNLYPLLLIDLWEHAYYLDYKNRREEYIENFVKAINLHKVEERYIRYLNCFGK